MGFSRKERTRRLQLEEASQLEPCNGRARSRFGLGASDEGFGAECCARAVKMVGVSAAGWSCVCIQPEIGELAHRTQGVETELQFEVSRKSSGVAALSGTSGVWGAIQHANRRGLSAGFLLAAVTREPVQPAYRRCCVASLPSTAFVRVSFRPSYRRSCVADFAANAVVQN